MDAYQKFAADRGAKREHNDCAVIAIAAATDKPYATVHAALKALGRRDRGRTQARLISPALKMLGAKVNLPYLPRHNTTSFREDMKHTKRRFVIFVPGHFTSFVDGEYQDYVAVGRRGRKIKAIWEVL